MCGAWACVQPCFKEVTAVFLRVKQGLLAEKTCFQAVCLSPSPAKQSRVESSLHVCINHTSPRQKSIATILPVKQNNRGQKNLPSTGLAICGDLPQDSTPCKPAQWQRATKACPKLLVSSWPWACGQKTLDFSNNNGHTCTLSS